VAERIPGARLLGRRPIAMNTPEVGLEDDKDGIINATDEGDGTLAGSARDDEPVGSHGGSA